MMEETKHSLNEKVDMILEYNDYFPKHSALLVNISFQTEEGRNKKGIPPAKTWGYVKEIMTTNYLDCEEHIPMYEYSPENIARIFPDSYQEAVIRGELPQLREKLVLVRGSMNIPKKDMTIHLSGVKEYYNVSMRRKTNLARDLLERMQESIKILDGVYDKMCAPLSLPAIEREGYKEFLRVVNNKYSIDGQLGLF